ncbi:MAG: hypothetical protein Fur0041_00480 [Bacteroidia bacterium]
MNPKELKRIFQNGECLSLDTMRLYNEGKLEHKSAHEVENHLLNCPLCSTAIEGLSKQRIENVQKVSSNIHKRLAVYMNTPPKASFMQRFGAYIVSGFLLAGIGAGLWLYFGKSVTAVPQAQQAFPKQETSLPSGVIHESENNPSSENPGLPPNSAVADQQPASREPVGERTSTVPEIKELPATSPGSEHKINVEPVLSETPVTPPASEGPGTNTRSVLKSAIRVKSVLVYPPVSHTDGKKRNQSSDGQLGRASGNTPGFTLDEMPTYPGGNEAIKAYILSNCKFTETDRSKLSRFSTGLLLQVNVKTGKVESAELSYPLSPTVDAEIMRVAKSMPDWNPGKKRGTVDVMIGITLE